MNSDVLESDPITKSTSIFHPSHDGDTFVLEERQDAEDIVEANKYLYNLHDQRAPWKDAFNRVASIPLVVYMELDKKGITRDKKAFMKWLDDPDNRAFRTRPGSLSK